MAIPNFSLCEEISIKKPLDDVRRAKMTGNTLNILIPFMMSKKMEPMISKGEKIIIRISTGM
jgi:hypothetical protein